MNRDEAANRALEVVNREFGFPTATDSIVILMDRSVETEHGWFFTYNTASYVHTGDPLKGLLGNGPIFVSQDGSQIQLFPSAFSLSRAVVAYEEEHGNKR